MRFDEGSAVTNAGARRPLRARNPVGTLQSARLVVLADDCAATIRRRAHSQQRTNAARQQPSLRSPIATVLLLNQPSDLVPAAPHDRHYSAGYASDIGINKNWFYGNRRIDCPGEEIRRLEQSNNRAPAHVG